MDLTILKMGLDVATIVKKLMPEGNRADKHLPLKQEISNALRVLYFTPRGVTALLKKINAGEKVTKEEVSVALIEFNDKEPRVERAAANLLYERLSDQYGISLAVIDQLEAVRYGKLSLRRQIQDEINFYGLRRTKPDQKAVKVLLSAIEELNAAIREVEEAVGETKR